jgi:hypothetical protein
MDKSSIDSKSMNNDNVIIPKASDSISKKSNKNPFSFQLNLNINFSEEIYAVKEISNHRIGIIFQEYLLIYSSHIFKQICCIFPFNDLKEYKNKSTKDLNPSEKDSVTENSLYHKQSDYKLHNFVELRNKDLIIWSDNNIFYYKLSKKNESYKIHQIINEFNQGTNSFSSGYGGIFEYYCLNSVNELMNGNLVSCNSFGLKFYKKEKDNYNLFFKIKMLTVENIIEFEENKIFLLQREYKSSGGCTDPGSDTYLISIYDIENNEIIEINKRKTLSRYFFSGSNINFMIKGEYLFVIYGIKFFIYNIKENMKLVQSYQISKNFSFYDDEKENDNDIKKEYNMKLLSNYLNEYFIARDINSYAIKIYSFKDEKISFCCDFPFQKEEIKGIIKLKNNNLIMYSLEQLEILGKI